MMDLGQAIHIAVTLAAAGVIVCRAGQMTPQTLAVVRWQHLTLLAGLLFGLAFELDGRPGLGNACTAGGVLAWLLLSAPRWRHGPPAGTVRR